MCWVTVCGRDEAATKDIMGYMVNTLAMKCDMSGGEDELCGCAWSCSQDRAWCVCECGCAIP